MSYIAAVGRLFSEELAVLWFLGAAFLMIVYATIYGNFYERQHPVSTTIAITLWLPLVAVRVIWWGFTGRWHRKDA